MRTLVGGARFLLLAVLFVFIFFLVVGLFPVISDERRVRLVKRWAPSFVRALGIRIDVRGKVPNADAATGLRRDGPGYLVCANHISFVDIFVLDAVLPVRFIAKKEIASWPLFGHIARHVGTIFIDRSSRRAVVDVAAAMERVMRSGENALFFPEGTTGPGDALLPFYGNLFSAAGPAGAEVLPVTLRYLVDGETSTMPSYAHRGLFPVMWDVARARNVSVEVTVLDPIDASNADRRRICAEASRVMAASLGWPDATAEKARALRERLDRAEAGAKSAEAAAKA